MDEEEEEEQLLHSLEHVIIIMCLYWKRFLYIYKQLLVRSIPLELYCFLGLPPSLLCPRARARSEYSDLSNDTKHEEHNEQQIYMHHVHDGHRSSWGSHCGSGQVIVVVLWGDSLEIHQSQLNNIIIYFI